MIQYGKRHPVALSWGVPLRTYRGFNFLILTDMLFDHSVDVTSGQPTKLSFAQVLSTENIRCCFSVPIQTQA